MRRSPMRTRERVLLATLAVAGLTVLGSATASAAATTEAPTSAQPADTFTLSPSGDAIRLAVHTTPLVDGTVPQETSSGVALTTWSDPLDNAVDALNDFPS